MTEVPAHFQKDAKPSPHQLRRRNSVLSALKGLRGDVLDYGCGWGDLTYQIAKTNPAKGVDVDPERVAFAQQQYAPIEFSQCRTDGLDFGDQTFDIVVSTVVVHFVPDPAAYLQEAHRVLKPGGYLVICCRNKPVVRNFLRRLIGKPEAPPTLCFPGQHLYFPDQKEFIQLLEKTGFKLLKRSGFYDPPLQDWRDIHVRTLVSGSIELLLSIFKVQATIHYYTILCHKPLQEATSKI